MDRWNEYHQHKLNAAALLALAPTPGVIGWHLHHNRDRAVGAAGFVQSDVRSGIGSSLCLPVRRRPRCHRADRTGAGGAGGPGLARLGVAKADRRYFTLHATLDLKHSEDWNREVVRPLVSEEPRAARAMAEGALMRLRAGARCFERYRRELKGYSQPSAASRAPSRAKNLSPMSTR